MRPTQTVEGQTDAARATTQPVPTSTLRPTATPAPSNIGVIVPHPTVGGDGIYLLRDPYREGSGIIWLGNGSLVEILNDNVAGFEIYSSNRWYQVRYPIRGGTLTGYVPAALVSRSEVTPPLPTFTPTPKSYPAPRPKGPESGRSFGDSPIRLEWDWTGSLVPGEEYFDVRVWRDGEPDPFWIDWAEASPCWLNLQEQPAGIYHWSVRVIRGHYKDGKPVFEGELSPDSERWRIQWAGPPKPTDTPTPEPSPPTAHGNADLIIGGRCLREN